MKKISLVLGILIALMCEISLLFINVIPKPLNIENEILAFEPIIYSKDISLEELIDSFNKILEKNSLEKVDLDYLTVIDNTYYIGLFQDIILFITPNDDNYVYQNGIIIDEDTNNFPLALIYYNFLIEANNDFLIDVMDLVDLVLEGELVDDNNGLLLGAISDDNEINLFIERKY